MLKHGEFPHEGVCNLPQYVVVTAGAAIVIVLAAPIFVAPQAPVYHPNEVPYPPEAVNVIEPPVLKQMLGDEELRREGGVGKD